MKPQLQEVTRRYWVAIAFIAFAGFADMPASATNGTWNQTAAGTYTWATPADWGGTTPNAISDTATLNTALAGNQTIGLGSANITLGSLALGASSGTFTYLLQTGTFTLNNNGSGAAITELSNTSGGDTISTSIVLADSLSNTIASNSTLSTSTFTISGGITGSQALTLAANNAGSIKVSGTINNTGTVTNSGSGAGSVTISNAFGTNVTTINQNSSTSTLVLSYGNTTDTLTLNINNGTVVQGAGLNSSNTAIVLANTAGATYTIGTNGVTIASLSGGGATGGTVITTGGNFTFGGTNVNATYNGALNNTSAANGATISTATTFTGTQTLNGTTSIGKGGGLGFTSNGGTLIIGANAVIGTGTFVASAIQTANSGSLIIQNGASIPKIANGIVQGSTGTFTINGGISANQGGTVSNGVMLIGSTGNISTAQGLTVSGGTLTEVSGGNLSNSNSNGGGLTVTGNGTAIMNSSANTYTGGTTVNQGLLQIGANAPVSAAGALGNSNGSVTFGANTSDSSGTLTGSASILTDAGGITIARAITERTGTVTTTSFNIGGNQTSGTSTYTGNISLTHATTLTAAAGGAVNFNDVISGAQNVTVSGGGLVLLTGTSTFGGSTNTLTVQSGTLTTLNAGSNLGNATNVLAFNGGTYQFASGSSFDLSARTIGFLSAGGTIDTNGNTETFANAIGAGGTGTFTGGLTVSDTPGTGTLILAAANTYSGGTTVAKGTLETTGAGTLGSTTAALAVNTGGNLDLHGTSQNVGNLSGTGGNIYNNGSGTSTLTIGNGNAGGSSYLGVIENNTGSGGTMALTKTGTGTIGLTGANTYTGATTINQGGLSLGGTGSLAGTAVTVNNGGTLSIGINGSTLTTTIGTSGAGSLNLNGGSLSFSNGVNNSADTAIKNLDINSSTNSATALNLASGAINIGVGGSGGSDEIVLGGTGTGLLTSLSGTITVNLNVLTALNGTSQELIAYGSGGITGSGSYVIGTVGGLGANGYSLTLTSNSTGLFLNESQTSNAYWKGGQGTSWATGLPGGSSNFTTDSAGSINRTASLDNQTSVVFVATGGANYANTTLDGSPTINNLTFNVGGVGIANGSGGSGSGNVLTIAGATGILVNSGLGAVTETISANVALGGSQTWTVSDAASTMIVSGNVSGAGFNLVKGGNGTLVLSGVNSYSGVTTVSAGNLNIQGADALDGTSGVTVNSGAALQLQSATGFTTTNATNLTLNGTGTGSAGALENVNGGSGGNTYTGSITLGSTSSIGSDAGLLSLTGTAITNSGFTLTLVGAGNGYISAPIGGSGGLTMSGTGMWTLDGANTYTGITTVNSGTLQIGNSGNGTFGTGTNTLAVNGGVVDANGFNLTVGNLTGSGGTITNSYPFESVLFVGSGTNSSYGGSIANGDSGAGILDLNKQGSGTQTLTGSNSYTGPTTVSAGALNIAGANALSAGTSVTVSNGAALQLTGGVSLAAVPLSLTGTGISGGALENVSGNNTYTGAITLAGSTSIGSDAGLLTLSTGGISGSGSNLTLIGAGNGLISDIINTGGGSLTMNGTGTWTLSGNNTYTGATSVTKGTLAYTAASVLQNTSAINIGSSVAGVTPELAYAGSGGTVSKTLNFSGTDNITLGNIGTGAIIYSGTPTFAANNTTLVLGNATDTIGGSIGGIANGTGFTTSLIKQGAENSTWILTGSNTYTGNTTINGGVLQVASVAAIPSGNLILQGNSADPAVLQTSGTLTTSLGNGAGQLQWNGNSGFAAINGNLTLNVGTGTLLTWGTNFNTSGAALLAFGSSTANSQVILQNNINLNTTDQFQRNIWVAKGTGGDSALISGALLNGPGTGATSGFTKLGGGTLILTNSNSTYSGYTTIYGGTLVAEATSTVTVANSTSTSTGVFGSGFGAVGAGTGAAGTGSAATYVPVYLGSNEGGLTLDGVINPTLMVGSPTVGGTTSISNPVNVLWTNGTGQVYGIGGYTDSNNTFAGSITLSGTAASGNTFAVTQVATTGSDALNVTGGITATNGGNISFANIGAVNVTTTGISNGGATAVSVTQSGSGTTTFAAANTYTGSTTVNAGLLRVNGSLASGSAATVNSGGAIGGTGTINGSLTVNGGGAINLADGTIGTLTVGTLTLGTGSTALTFDIGAGSTNNLDSIANLGALTTNGSSAITIGFVSGSPTLTAGTYTLISGAITPTQFSTFSLTDPQLGLYALSLVNGGASGLELMVTSNAPVTTYYYTGATSTDFTDFHNYNTGASNSTQQTTALSSTSDVTIGTTSPTPSNLAPVANSNISIDSLSFASSGAGATLSGTGTVSIAAAGGIGIADSASNSATTETVATAVALGSNQSWTTTANSTLNVTGSISGPQSLALTGAGTFKLGGANTFQGLTVGTGSDTPTVLLTNGSNGSATGTTTLAVKAGATLGGTGTSSGTSFNIAGTGTTTATRANVLAGLNSTTDTSVGTTLTLKGTSAATIADANLTFNISSASLGTSSQLNVGTTAVAFGAGAQSTILTLNVQGDSHLVIPANTGYVLVAGLDLGQTNAATSQYSGLSFGTSTGSLATGLITPILNSGNGATGNLVLSLSGGAAGYYGSNSYLFLYQTSSGVDDIEVEVVPEPGTWAMMIGGLAVLIAWQRRKSRA